MSIFSLLPFAAYGAGPGIDFNNSSAISQWRFEHVSEARFIDGGLLLKGNNYVRIAPPTDFRRPAGRMAMELRFKAPKSLIVNIRIRAADGWQAAKTVRVKVAGKGDMERTLNIYLGKHSGGGAGTYVRDFVVEFYGKEKVELRLDALRLYRPGGLGLVSLLWGEFWTPDFITGQTIGFVTAPEAGGLGFISMLYILIGLAFISALILYRLRGHGLSRSRVTGALVIIFLFASLLFTLRMDYNWLSIFRYDVETLSPVGVQKRIDLVNNRDLEPFFDFIRFVKGSVPAGMSIRPATIVDNSPLAAIARYYLLPLDNSDTAGFLWSYGEDLRIDPDSGALYDGKGTLIAARARLFAAFAKNAAVYEVIK